MIPQTQEREILSGGVRGSSSFDISQENVAHILTILRDTLYSDKIMAVLREYGANAWDEHRKMGKADVPIRVTLPTFADPTLRIRDYGPGLSPDGVERIFTKYGASTKRDDNLAVGMLGIGSKSGFAYSDSFTVTSWHGGVRRQYVAVIDESQKGRMDLLHEQRLDSLETGLEISLAVKPQDIREFESRAQRLFQHFVPQPTINTTLPKGPTGRRVEIDGRLLGVVSEETGWESRGKWTAVMGCVPYRIDLAQLGRVVVNGQHHEASPCVTGVGGVLYFDIGDLTIAASREELKYSEPCRLAIIKRINELIDEYVRQMLSGIEDLPQWERRLRVRQVDGLNLPVPKDHKSYADGYVTLKVPKDALGKETTFTLSRRNYNGGMSKDESVRVNRNARLVIKDDKRTIKGFSLGENDMLVSPANGTSLAVARAALKVAIQAAAIEGIPTVLLSSVAWTAPPRSSPTGLRDAAKARAQVLLLNATTPDFGGIPLSRHWEVVSHKPTDADVYVVLESYRVGGHVGPTGDFYEQWLQDRRMLADIGLSLPPVIGYKEMASKPLSRAKLKGTDYGAWRSKGLIALMKTHPKMKEVIEAIEDGGEAGYDMDVGLLEKELGAEHTITKFAAKVNAARAIMYKADKKLAAAARMVRSAGPDKLDNTAGPRKEILDRYPLFRTVGQVEATFGIYNASRSLWTDYVLMVDLFNSEKAEDKKENAA